MEYTHKFSNTLSMEKVLNEYFNLKKVRNKCRYCKNFQKYWSCPEFAFNEKILLSQFKYMYLIGREFSVPKQDRQKVIGIRRCTDYVNEVSDIMKVESWRTLMELEDYLPDVLTLMPGHCHICDLSGEGCAKKEHKVCRHPDMMRFSLESLGIDVDSLCKFEIGLMIHWTNDGHLPEKISASMAILSNEHISRETLQHFFPDAKRSVFAGGEALMAEGDRKPEAKRKESWLDNQAAELMAKETDPNFEKKQHWIGFKSDTLDSGDYVKNRSWAEGDDEYPDPPADSPYVQAQAPTPEPQVVAPQPVAPEPEPAAPMTEEEEDAIKYKWLGFKRTDDEATEMMYNRPIPKFSKTEEEEAAEAEEPVAEAAEPEPSMAERMVASAINGEEFQTQYAAAANNVSAAEQMEVERALDRYEAEEKAQPQVAPDNQYKNLRTQFEEALKAQMAGMSDAQAAAFLAEKMGITLPQPEPQPQQPTYRYEPEPEPEPVELPDAGSVADVLGAALNIAKTVATTDSNKNPRRRGYTGRNQQQDDMEEAYVSEFMKRKREQELEAALFGDQSQQAAPVPEPEPDPEEEIDVEEAMMELRRRLAERNARKNGEAAIVSQTAPAAPAMPRQSTAAEQIDAEDDSKYKWLGYKADMREADGFPKKWKKNY